MKFNKDLDICTSVHISKNMKVVFDIWIKLRANVFLSYRHWN